MLVELKIQALGRDVDEVVHMLRMELLAALRDLPETRRRIEQAPDGAMMQWTSAANVEEGGS